MTQSHLPPTLQEGDGVHVDDLTRPLEGTPEGRATIASPPKAAARPSGWSAGRITALVIGVLLVLLSLVLLGTGGTALWADQTQRDAGYATSDVHRFSTSGAALATVSTELGSGGVSWLYPPTLLDKVRVRVTPTTPGPPLFVGIGPSTEVDRYLAGVDQTVITEFWGDKTEARRGRSARIRSGNAGLLGRLHHRVWTQSSSGIRLMVRGPSWSCTPTGDPGSMLRLTWGPRSRPCRGSPWASSRSERSSWSAARS